jgi:hypothetical protein
MSADVAERLDTDAAFRADFMAADAVIEAGDPTDSGRHTIPL